MNTVNACSVTLACLLGAASFSLAQSETRFAREVHGTSFKTYATHQKNEVAAWFEGRLELGARIHHFSLRDTRRTVSGRRDNNNIRINFIGSVWGLDEIQDVVPRLFLQYAVTPWCGLGLTYDRIAARTRDWGNVEKTRYGTDGDVRLWGPMIYLFVRYPNPTRFTPRAEAGWIRYFADFDVNPAWAATAPGYRFEVDDTDGYFLALALNLAINNHWHAEAYWRRLYNAEVDARAYFTPGPRVGRYGAFPMEYDMFGLGVTYVF